MELKQIVEWLGTEHTIKLGHDVNLNDYIENVYKLEQKRKPEIENILFIKNTASDKPGFFLEKVKNSAESYILKIPESNLSEAVYENLIRFFNRHHQLKHESRKLFSYLQEGKGIDQIVKLAHLYLKNPISICDASFSIIASYPRVDDKQNLITVNKKQYLKDIKFQDMLDRNIIEHLVHSNESIITKIEGYNHRWLFKSIRIGNKTIGYICIREKVRSFNNSDLEYIDIFSDILAVELQKNIFNQDYPTNRFESYFINLLNGDSMRSDNLSQMFLKGLNSEPLFYWIGLVKEKDNNSKFRQQKLVEEIKTLFSQALCVTYEGKIVILIAQTIPDAFNKINTGRVKTFLELNKLNLFLSYPFMDLKKTPIYYRQVKDLSTNEERVHFKNGNIYEYGQFFLKHLFQNFPDKDQLRSTIHPDIRKLYDYDLEYKTEFLKSR